MIQTLVGGVVVTAHSVQHQTLVIDTRRGVILPTTDASRQVINAEGLYLYPGLINGHEHLEFNHYPRTKYQAVYANASQWAAEVNAHLDQEPLLSLRQKPLQARCWIGGLKI